MPILTRRRLLIAGSLVVLVLVAVEILLFVPGPNLKFRSAPIAVGMPREQVEGILGPPELVLKRQSGKGSVLVWVDYLWQVDVVIGPDGRVESMGCTPSDSMYRETVGRLIPLPK